MPTYVPMRIHKANYQQELGLGAEDNLLFPTTNQLAKALKSSVLNRLHPRIVNHLIRILSLCHHPLAAAKSSSLDGR
jgi:hypothetical protein